MDLSYITRWFYRPSRLSGVKYSLYIGSMSIITDNYRIPIAFPALVVYLAALVTLSRHFLILVIMS